MFPSAVVLVHDKTFTDWEDYDGNRFDGELKIEENETIIETDTLRTRD